MCNCEMTDDEIGELADAAEQVPKLEAEIERLQTELRFREPGTTIVNLLRADNERLRAVLEKIAHLTPMILTGADSPAAHLAQRMGVIATDALEQKMPLAKEG